MGCHPGFPLSTRRFGSAKVSQLSSRVARGATLFLCVCTLFMAAFAATTAEAKMRRDKLTLETTMGDVVIDIEVAETPAEKSLGLMYRTNVPEKSGMLFPYPQPNEITMWMRNTYISLDMVFIRADGVVHRIEANTEPMSEKVIGSVGPVTAVLELAAGAAERLSLKPGARVRHAHFRNAKP